MKPCVIIIGTCIGYAINSQGQQFRFGCILWPFDADPNLPLGASFGFSIPSKWCHFKKVAKSQKVFSFYSYLQKIHQLYQSLT